MGSKQQVRNRQEATLPATDVSRFCYRIGSNLILLEPETLAEVLMAQTVYPVPFPPEWCAGLISLRGDLYPVVDMHKIVQGKSMPEGSQLLFIRHPRFPPVVFSCDGYPRQLKLPVEDTIEHPAENLPGWIPYVLYHAGQTLLAADHGRLLRRIQRTTNS